MLSLQMLTHLSFLYLLTSDPCCARSPSLMPKLGHQRYIYKCNSNMTSCTSRHTICLCREGVCMAMHCSANLTCQTHTWCGTSKEHICRNLQQSSYVLSANVCSPRFLPSVICVLTMGLARTTLQEAVTLQQADAGCIRWIGMILPTLWHSQSLAGEKGLCLQPLCTLLQGPCYPIACTWRSFPAMSLFFSYQHVEVIPCVNLPLIQRAHGGFFLHCPCLVSACLASKVHQGMM